MALVTSNKSTSSRLATLSARVTMATFMAKIPRATNARAATNLSALDPSSER